jgi:hypothetical protein
LLRAYFDESGIHAGSPVTLIAGFIGSRRQWRAVERRWQSIMGDRVFHYKNMRMEREMLVKLATVLSGSNLGVVASGFSGDWKKAISSGPADWSIRFPSCYHPSCRGLPSVRRGRVGKGGRGVTRGHGACSAVPTAALLVGTADLAPRINRYVGAAFAPPYRLLDISCIVRSLFRRHSEHRCAVPDVWKTSTPLRHPERLPKTPPPSVRPSGGGRA